jgi:hypothetical protein
MKLVLCVVTLIHCTALGAKAHAACGFIPPFIHENIRDYTDDLAIKQSAEFALQHLSLINDQRNQGQDGDGILVEGDDKAFPNEETVFPSSLS